MLQSMAETLSVGVTRMYDLRLLEERNQELQQSEGKYRDLYDNAPAAYFTVGTDGRILRANQQAQALLGYSLEDFASLRFQDIYADAPDGKPKARIIFQRFLDGERTIHEELQMRRTDDTIVWVDLSVEPVLGEDGEPVETRSIVLDITERKQLEEQLRQSQKMEAVGQLTAGIAHNFNNRLMVILNTFEAARLRGTVGLEDLALAEASAHRAAEMVDQLMLFSRSEATPGQGPVDLRQILTSVVEIGRRSFGPSIVVVDQVPDRIPPVSGVVSQLDQVFLNLLLNARDAVERAEQPASHVTVSVEEVSFEETDVALHPSAPPGAYLVVHVTDDGIGMDEVTRQRVFEPFFTTKEVGQGTGLGLATAYAVVQQHGGWIECHSEPGDGATFSVYLPVAPDQTAAPEAKTAETVKGGSETLLFVEDEEDVRRPLLDLLRANGYRVLVAGDGREGWTVFQRHQHDIDLILLDLAMPNMSGQELLARIRTVDPAAKVLVSTGRADAVAQLPGETVLRKPYRMTEALATIRDLLDQGSSV